MFPQVVSDSSVNHFKFWHDGIHEGMRLGGRLYGHVRSYGMTERLQAYELACDLSQKALDVCVTCAEVGPRMGYGVWVSLQSLQQAGAMGQEAISEQATLYS